MGQFFETALWCLFWLFGTFAVIAVLVDAMLLEFPICNRHKKWNSFLKCTAAIFGSIIICVGIFNTLFFISEKWLEYKGGVAFWLAIGIVALLSTIINNCRKTYVTLYNHQFNDEIRKEIDEIDTLEPQKKIERLAKVREEMEHAYQYENTPGCHNRVGGIKSRVLLHYEYPPEKYKEKGD